eukprot:11199176-Lingulodinium_polyedra.AAC.1
MFSRCPPFCAGRRAQAGPFSAARGACCALSSSPVSYAVLEFGGWFRWRVQLVAAVLWCGRQPWAVRGSMR